MQQQVFSKILLLLFLLPGKIFAQDIAGIWKGLIYADTIQGYKPYEVAISEEKGKLDGYSQTIYIIDGKEEVWIRRLKVNRKDDKVIFEDIGVVDNGLNIPQSKGVRKVSVLTLSYSEGEVLLTGEWSSNRTKQFIAMHGTIQLLKENEYKNTGLFKKLDSLKLSNKLSFHLKDNKVTPPPTEVAVVQKPVEKPKEIIVKKEEIKPAPEPIVVPPAAELSSRKIATTQTVYYKSDSLTLTLYDNGEVDGDIVSILMNGKAIFAKQELSTRANSKTIYFDKDTPDSVMLVMYAENLGSIPPNTGLMVINDGNDRYELRFSADLKSNAAIILKRKK